MHEIVIVGAGLFGSVIARALAESGRQVTIVDDHRPLRGSDPAACLMKPSWFSGLGPKVYQPALNLLDELYELEDVDFAIAPGMRTSVHWVPPSKILRSEHPCVLRIDGTVTELTQQRQRGAWSVKVRYSEHEDVLEAYSVVLATGVWTNALAPVPGLVGRAGVAFLWPGAETDDPTISVWAPYRQLVVFNRGDGLWASDGTAVKLETFTDKRVDESLVRCTRNIEPGEQPRVLRGIRPYVPGVKPAYLEEHMPGFWVATGGAKNGTLAAAWCAHQLRTRI